jgi:uncharacterized protein
VQKETSALQHAIVALVGGQPANVGALVDAAGIGRPEPTPRKQISVTSPLRVSDRKCAWMLPWFQALLPMDDRFFELFAAHSHAIVAGAQGLRALLEGGDIVPQYYRVVTERENDADNATRDILIAVRRSFITPFDRGAIKDLITAMDDSIDQMLKTAKAVMLFDIRSFSPEMKEIGDAVVNCALLVEEAIPLLRSISEEAARINAITEQIGRIEGLSDDLHDVGVRALFERHGGDPMGYFTEKEVYDHLEKIVDRFNDVANELQGVMIEHV